jgi:putative GTP pyrophosphokinase
VVIHDIYEYDTTSIKGALYKGLLLELQYRTRCQHAWATSVELLTHLTGHEPKFNRGDIKYIEFFRLASEVIARTREDLKSCYDALSNEEVAKRLEDIDSDIHVMVMLRKMRPSRETAKDASVLILQIAEDGELRIREFSGQSAATVMYFKLEKEHPKDDIVLVNADTFESIRTAYRNYFSDVDEFVKFIDVGCRELKSSSMAKGKMETNQYTDEEAQRRFEAALRGAREVGHESMKEISPKRPKSAMKVGKVEANPKERPASKGRVHKGKSRN